MNNFKIWIKAQLYNFILCVIVCILLLILDLAKYAIKDNQITETIIYISVLILAYGTISFLGGIPLILLFKATNYLSKKLNSNTLIKKIIEMIAYPLSTFIYLIILFYLIEYYFDGEIYYTETFCLTIPAVISTFISVIVHQYQDKKKRENEINTLTS
jgi:hypothetical protein